MCLCFLFNKTEAISILRHLDRVMNAIVDVIIHAWEELQNTAIAIQGIFVNLGDYWESPQNASQENGAPVARATYDENECLGDTGHSCKMKTWTAS